MSFSCIKTTQISCGLTVQQQSEEFFCASDVPSVFACFYLVEFPLGSPFSLAQFYLYSSNSQQQFPKGASFCKVKSYNVKEKRLSDTEQLFDNSGKEELPFNKKKLQKNLAQTGAVICCGRLGGEGNEKEKDESI